MRRSASEIINNLERRIARLEKQSASGNPKWDDEENIESETMQYIRKIEGYMIGEWTLVADRVTDASYWENRNKGAEIYISVDESKNKLFFEVMDNNVTVESIVINDYRDKSSRFYSLRDFFITLSKLAIRKLG